MPLSRDVFENTAIAFDLDGTLVDTAPDLVRSLNAVILPRGLQPVRVSDVREMVGRGFELAGELVVDEVMLIGGAQLYARLMPFCDRLYVSDVDVIIDGDAHFPAISPYDWRIESETYIPIGEKDDYAFTIRQYSRKRCV